MPHTRLLIPGMLLQLDRWSNEMVGNDLERLALPHNKPDLPSLLVLQQLHAAGPPLLPLVALTIKPVQLRLQIEEHILVLLASGDDDLLELDDGGDLGAGVLILGGGSGGR